MQILLYFLLTLHVLVCLLMVLVVLMQRPRNEGLGAAFGSGMTDNLFGAQTTHVLAKFTTWLGGGFFLLTLALAMVYARINTGNTAIDKELMSMPQPAASPTPAPVGEPLPSPAAATAPAVVGTPSATPAAAPAESPAPAAAEAPNIPVEAATPAATPAN